MRRSVARPAPDWAEMTLPRLLRWRGEGPSGSRPALRHKDRGIWQTVSWREYWEAARLVAAGLMALGLEPGEKVGVVADNIPEWYFTELGTQAARGVCVGVYQSGMPREVAYALSATDTVFVLAEDQEQVDKLLEVRSQLPLVRRVIYQDPRGMRRYRDDPWLMSFEELLDLGRRSLGRLSADLERRLAAARPDEVCLMCFSSGTTSDPKPVMLTHSNLITMGRSFQDVEHFKQTDQHFSFLPLAWIGEQMMAVAAGLVVGFAVNCPEQVETALTELREIGPHLMFSPPRIWEGFTRQVRVKIEDSTPLKRLAFRAGMAVGERVADRKLAGRAVPLGLRLLHRALWWILYRPLLDRLGLVRLRKAYTAGAALGPDVFRFFHALGINLKQGYGQTE
ncbi:MAG: AMP-binding protein, partial [Bacillota bacterium]